MEGSRVWLVGLLVLPMFLSGCADCPDHGHMSGWSDPGAYGHLATLAVLDPRQQPHDPIHLGEGLTMYLDPPLQPGPGSAMMNGHWVEVPRAKYVLDADETDIRTHQHAPGVRFLTAPQEGMEGDFMARLDGLPSGSMPRGDLEHGVDRALLEVGWQDADARAAAVRRLVEAQGRFIAMEGPFNVTAVLSGADAIRPWADRIDERASIHDFGDVRTGAWLVTVRAPAAEVQRVDGGATWVLRAGADGFVTFSHQVAWGGENPRVDEARHHAALDGLVERLGLMPPKDVFTDPGAFPVSCIY